MQKPVGRAMAVYGTHHVKTHLSELLRMVERGETITILRGQVPVAVLVRIGAIPQARRPGTLRAKLRMNPMLDFRAGPRRPRANLEPESPAPGTESA